MDRKNKIKRTISWAGVLLWIIVWILLNTNWAEAQYIGTQRWVTRQEMVDSLAAYQSMTGLTGTVAAGVVAVADSTGAVAIASYDDSHLNRKLIGFGTGIAGVMRTSGLVAAAGATKIGIIYWLDVSGTLKDTRPTATNVWRVAIGRCTATGYLDLKPAVPIARIP